MSASRKRRERRAREAAERRAAAGRTRQEQDHRTASSAVSSMLRGGKADPGPMPDAVKDASDANSPLRRALAALQQKDLDPANRQRIVRDLAREYNVSEEAVLAFVQSHVEQLREVANLKLESLGHFNPLTGKYGRPLDEQYRDALARGDVEAQRSDGAFVKQSIRWLDDGRKATQPSDPKWPEGIDLDISKFARKSCKVDLPYPATGCGKWSVECRDCGYTAMVSAAGRADDPRSVRLPCKDGPVEVKAPGPIHLSEREAAAVGAIMEAMKASDLTPERKREILETVAAKYDISFDDAEALSRASVLDIRKDKTKPASATAVAMAEGIKMQEAMTLAESWNMSAPADAQARLRTARKLIGRPVSELKKHIAPDRDWTPDPSICDQHGNLRSDIVIADATLQGNQVRFSFTDRKDFRGPVYDRSLLDLFQEALSTGKGLATARNLTKEPHRQYAHAILGKLREARCFSLDDDFVRVAAELSMGDVGQLYNLWQSARLPYPRVWVEFDEVERVRAIHRASGFPDPDNAVDTGPSGPNRTGFLLEQDPHDPARFFCSNVFTSRDGTLLTGFTGFAVDTEKNASLPQVNFHNPRTYHGFGLKDLPEATQQGVMNFELRYRMGQMIRDTMQMHFSNELLETSIFGRSYLFRQLIANGDPEKSRRMLNENIYKVDPTSANPDKVELLRKILRRIQPCISPFLPLNEWRMNMEPGESNAHRIGKTLVSSEGDARMACVVLGLLQSTWTQTAKVRHAGSPRYVRGKTIPYLEQHVLTIVAPKQRQVTLRDIAHMTGGGSKRRHEVIGHWAYRNSKLNVNCTHEWKRTGKGSTESQQECDNCGGLRWWKKPFYRGDASKGFVEKDYHVIAPEHPSS